MTKRRKTQQDTSKSGEGKTSAKYLRATCQVDGCRNPYWLWSNGRYLCNTHRRIEAEAGETIESNIDL